MAPRCPECGSSERHEERCPVLAALLRQPRTCADCGGAAVAVNADLRYYERDARPSWIDGVMPYLGHLQAAVCGECDGVSWHAVSALIQPRAQSNLPIPTSANPPRPMPTTSIYQLKVTIVGSEPPIWRRLQVPANITLNRLHRVLQAAMEWEDYHLHQFRVGDRTYSRPDFELEDTADERSVRLSKVAPEAGSRFFYDYDFGDDWEHEIVVEEILAPEPDAGYPRCIDGERAGPLEDSGGIMGYTYKLQVMANRRHPDRRELMEWMPEGFDPEAFDKLEVNRRLKTLR